MTGLMQQDEMRGGGERAIGVSSTTNEDCKRVSNASDRFSHKSSMKIAMVCDWLVTYAGAERVVTQLLQCFPEADLFAVIDFLEDDVRQSYFLGKKATTTFIQRLPKAKTHYRTYLPLMPLAIEQLDLSAYDLIISSSHAVAKGVITGPDQLHISYVHSPMRYAWDFQHQYLRESGLQSGLKSMMTRYLLHRLRLWDYASAARVDHFIVNSQYIKRRIQKVYRREATVINPPVDIEHFACCKEKENFYLTASRFVPYKRIDLIVKAFAQMPDKRLVVVGDGPDEKKIKPLAHCNTELKGYLEKEALVTLMQQAKAFIFAAEEDFGIVPVEAQACGTPVIAYGRGGACETIVAEKTGLFFEEQTVESVIEAVQRFESMPEKMKAEDCRANALRFSAERFRQEILEYMKKIG